jgi:PAS domain S-box-containing protein
VAAGKKAMRKSGIDVVGPIPWGTHLCQFYETDQDLREILVPYFKQGLEQNEHCIWVTAGSLGVNEAHAALSDTVAGCEEYFGKGQIEILDYRHWYGVSGEIDVDRLLRKWLEKEQFALCQGYDGLRVSGNESWLGSQDWAKLTEYEAAVNATILHRRMIAICSYSIRQCSALQMLEVAGSHSGSLLKQDGQWKIAASRRCQRTQALLCEAVSRNGDDTFHAIADSTVDWEDWVSSDGKLFWVNSAVERHTGYSVAECLAMADYPICLIYEADRAALQSHLDGRSRETRGEPVEFRVTQKDGSLKWCEASWQPIFDSALNHRGYRSRMRDITKRRQVDDLLRQSEKKYRDLIENLNEGVWAIDDGSYTTFVNPRMAEMLGYTESEMIGQHLFSFMDAQGIEICKRNVERRRQGIQEQHDFEFVRKDGSRMYTQVATAPIIDGASRYQGAIAGVMDVTDRKKAEVESQRAREEWERTFDAVPDLIAILDRQKRVVRVNQAMADRLKVSREDCVGRLCHELVHGTQDVPETCPHRVFASDGREHRAEVHDKRLGTDFLVTVSPLSDSSGQANGCVHIARDVTKERWSQRERETTLVLLRLLSDRNHTHELIRNLTKFLQDWTGCEAVGVRLRDGDDFPYYETRGFSQEFLLVENQLCLRDAHGEIVRDSVGNPVLDCMCGNVLCGRFDPSLPFFTQHGSFWSNCTSELLANTTEADRQTRTRNRCNGEGYESVALIPLRHGDQTLGLLQLNDHAKERFTPELIAFLENAGDQIALALAQRQMQAALQESETRYRTLFTTMAEGFALHEIICDENGNPCDYRFLDMNPAFSRITGIAHDVVGRTIREILPHEAAEWVQTYGDVALTGRPTRFERCSTALGKHFEVFAYCPAPRRFATVFLDITERKLAEEERYRLQQQLAHVARLSTLGEMVAGIAHDVNQPLYSIMNYAKACSNVFAQETPNQDKLREWNERIAAEAGRAGEIIKRMRDLVRKAAVRRLPTSIREVVDESLSLISFETHGLRVNVCKDIAESVFCAYFDRIQIQQVLVNLLRNACEALVDRPLNERRLTIRAIAAGGFVEVVVADNGPGVTGVESAKIFEPFFTSKPAGLGMGLAISKSIIDAHGGRIWVTAIPEGGAAFHFTLPSTTEGCKNG